MCLSRARFQLALSHLSSFKSIPHESALLATSLTLGAGSLSAFASSTVSVWVWAFLVDCGCLSLLKKLLATKKNNPMAPNIPLMKVKTFCQVFFFFADGLPYYLILLIWTKINYGRGFLSILYFTRPLFAGDSTWGAE